MPIGLYLISLEATTGLAGAPTLHFSGTVNAVTGAVNGHAQITQALPPPDGVIEIPHVTGKLIRGPAHNRLLTLEGTYAYSFPPPIILTVIETFSAHLFVGETNFDGVGEFTYQHKTIKDAKVTSQPFHEAKAA